MFLQQAPAETFNYMVLGFSVIIGVLFVYIISILVRFRNLKKDITLLQEVDVGKDSEA
jgi:hypothetical protein